MRRAKYFGIEKIEYRFYNHWADPTVTYKDHTWSEWELADEIQSHIDEGIEEGFLPEGMTIQEWVQLSGSKEYILCLLDDMLYAAELENA